MKRALVYILENLYAFKTPIFRRCLRASIARLEGGQAFSDTLRRVVKKYHGFDIGIGTYGPCYSPEQTWTGHGRLKVGKYTSIASGVCLYSRNHPYEKPSVSPLFYNASFGAGKAIEEDTVQYGSLEIGNDVWIGQYAVVLPSCHVIGDGAVIGAGCIVTKDVPPYAVVIGNPGRILKYRFDEDKINTLQRIQWWNWNRVELIEHAADFQSLDRLLAYAEYRENRREKD